MQENQNLASEGSLTTNEAKPSPNDEEVCSDLDETGKPSCSSNRIRPNYAVTPDLEHIFRKRYDDQSIKFAECGIEIEQNNISSKEFYFQTTCEAVSNEDVLKGVEILIQCVQVHQWKVKRNLRIEMDLPEERFLKNRSFAENMNFSHLRDLDLFLKSEDASSRTLPLLTSKITRHLTHLQKLRLYFFQEFLDSNIASENLRILSREISQNLTHLTDLSLDFYNNARIDDKGVKSFVSPICRYLRRLKSLALSIPHCSSISDKALKSTGYLIGRHLLQLRSLELHFASFEDTKISDSGIQALMLNLDPLRENLQQLTIQLKYCPLISDEGLRICSDHLRHFSNLHSLTLDFSYCPKISDQGFGFLTSSITNNLIHLRKLSLDLSKCTEITDEGLKVFDFNLLSQLRDLTLNFIMSHGITDKGFQIISNKLVQLHHLKKLDLKFISFEKITDESLRAFKNEFGGFETGLEEISLNMTGCKAITDKGLDDIISSFLINFKKLKVLSLQTIGSQVTTTAIKNANRALKHLSRAYIC